MATFEKNLKPPELSDVESSRKSSDRGNIAASKARKQSEKMRKTSERTRQNLDVPISRKISESPRKTSEVGRSGGSSRKISTRKISEKKISFRGENFELESEHRNYAIPVDFRDGDKATELRIFSFAFPHMRNFHFAWMSLFLSFFSWFSFSSMMPEIKKSLNLSQDQVFVTNIASYILTIIARISTGPLCDQFGPRIVEVITILFYS